MIESPSPATDLITIAEAIDLLPRYRGKKIHRSTIQRWIESNKLKTVKIGGRRYVSRAVLFAMMESRVESPPDFPPASAASRASAIATPASQKRKAASLKAQDKAALDRLRLLRASG